MNLALQIIARRLGGASTSADQWITDSTYDTFGRLTQVSSDEGILNHAYNDLGQLVRTFTSKTTAATDAVTDTVYTYDIFGRLETVTLEERNDDPTVSEQTTYAYDLVGNLDTVTLPNGVVSDYQYDALHRLVSLTHTDGPTVLSSYDYALAVNGHRVGVAERDDQDRLTEIDWVYDDLGRLIQEDYDSHDNALDYTADYLFDLVGNRVKKDVDALVDEAIMYVYDDNDRLLTETKDVSGGTVDDRHTVYEYGPGAISGTFGGDWTVQSKKTVYEGLDDTGTKLSETTSTYNLQGRLRQTDIDSDGDGDLESRSTYEYNDAVIRVSQTVETDTTGDGVRDDVSTTDYVIDNNNHTGYAQVLEEKVAGTVVKTYTLGHDVISQQAPADASGDTLFLLPDGHGSTRQLVDDASTPNVLESYSYDAYGNAIGFDATTALTTFLYSGEQTDRATGQQYLRARYYDAVIGRFNRLDPFAGNAQDPQSLHKYLYAHGNPINLVDPTGMFGLGVGIGVSIAIGATLGGIAGGVDAYLGGDSILAGVGFGAAFGAAAGAGVAYFPALFASKAALGLGVGLGALGAIDSFARGKNAQGYFRVFSGLAIPLAIRNAAISRLAGIANSRIRGLWSAVRPRTNALLAADDAAGGIAGSLVSRRVSIDADLPSGEYIYVFDVDGNGWAVPSSGTVNIGGSIRGVNHSGLVPRGASVRTAGRMRINADGSVDVNADSGHFMALDSIAANEEAAWLAAITEAFWNSGLPVRNASPGFGAFPGS